MSAEPPSAVESLTAVVLDWNHADLAIRSVKGLLGEGVPARRIVVVDNGSTDENWQRLSSQVGSCRLVRLDENVGFARGNNAGARALDGSAYLFVNSDAFVHRRGSVSALVRALDRPDVGAVVPRLLNEDLTLQPSVVPAHRPSNALARASGLSRFIPNTLQPHWSTHWDHGSSRVIECAVGAVMLVRGPLWHELGGFPETGFMYAEDLELCLAVSRRGWKVWFESEAEFVHVGGGSTSARWDDEARAERVGRANAALIRSSLSPLAARLTLAFTRLGLAGRLGIEKLARNRAAAAEYRGALRGYGASTSGSHK
ncbi:MAG TPA: glycosyltransferase family 2 protein [Gaiellaceae bacterium]|nr:glycosyltransferase family 2 protein [Gaiellaceae bacterium]